jgi:predicted permease
MSGEGPAPVKTSWRAIGVLLSRLRAAFGGRRLDADFDDEIRTHLELLAADHERRGLTPSDARAAALRDFGGVVQVAEAYRAQRGLPLVDALAQDVRYALRTWRRAPGFAAVVVVVLALGIGVNSAMFTVVNALLFRPLPGRAAQLVGLYSHDPTQPNSYRTFSYPNYADIRDHNDVFDGLIAYTFAIAGRPAGDVMRRTFVEVVSANFFGTIGVRLAAGRTFTDDEDKPGANIPVAVASYASWQESGFDPALVGRTVRINAQDFTVVGVAPKGFTGTTALIAPEFWVPLGVFDSVVNDIFKNNGHGLRDRSNASLMVAGQLKAGVTIEQANMRLAALAADLERAYPSDNRRQMLTVHSLSRVNVTSEPSTDAGPAVLSAIVMPLSASVLLIACLNIANMLLARGTARKKEIAIRLALGGGRGRIVRQLLTESFVLACVGAGGGLVVGWWASRVLVASLVTIIPMPLALDARPDLNIVLATTAFAMLSALAFGLLPALKLSRLDLVDDLKDLGSTRQPGQRFGTRPWLVVAQIAVSLMLMTAGGLFARGALRASVADPGYRYDRLLLASIDPSMAGYDAATGDARLRAALDRLRSLSGVAAAAANSQIPFGEFHEGRQVARLGQNDGGRVGVTYTIVTTDYFKTIDVPVVRGRDFTHAEEDFASRSRVAIIDEPLARRLFPHEEAIGQQLVIRGRPGGAPRPDDEQPMAIVGVVPGIRHELSDHDPVPHVYVPAADRFRGVMHIHVRTAAGRSMADMLGAIRRGLRSVDDRLPIVELRTMQDFHDRGLLLWVIRAAGRTLTGFGVLALLLAVVGVYGVKSYVVSQRTREIGIRLALGARPADVGWLLFRDGSRMTLVGLAIGFPLAVIVGRLLSAGFFDMNAFDPIVLTLAPLVLAAAAALATYLPARRGMRISPLDALRTE